MSALDTHRRLLASLGKDDSSQTKDSRLAVEGDFHELSQTYRQASHPWLGQCQVLCTSRCRVQTLFRRFLRTEEDDKDLKPWQLELAHKYYSKLFREYAIVDLSRFKVGLISAYLPPPSEVEAFLTSIHISVLDELPACARRDFLAVDGEHTMK